jgi:Prokaryotic Cytochrome C oxidase subunit IV
MIDFLRGWIHRSWLFLMVATAATFGLRAEGAVGLGAAAATLGIAYAKGRLVILNFMEVRHAPLWLRMILEVWLLAVSATLLTINAISRHP